ncbi:MAG TPA: kelch repeat-containing protein [Thermoplasmata archaeon]|nr:kelch repeat-containing protein [Thermoplasmata archaeon]
MTGPLALLASALGTLLMLVPTSAPLPVHGMIPMTGSGVAPLGAVPAAGPSPAVWGHLPAANGVAPSLREGAAVAYDQADQEVVLFGGCAAVCPLGDTWTYSGGVWTNLTAGFTVQPTARSSAAFAYDGFYHGLVLFGGRSRTTTLADQWVFRGNTWYPTDLTNATHPSARSLSVLVGDPRDSESVMFGGVDGNGSVLGDTWVLNGGSWQQLSLSPPSAPTARSASVATYYSGIRYVMLFGGADASGRALGDSWAFFGNAWSRLAVGATSAPPARASATFVFDSFLNSALLFGGAANGTDRSDTWLFTQGAWTNLTASLGRSPTPRSGAAGAYDLKDDYAVLVGGGTPSGLAPALWVFVNPLSAYIAATPSTVSPGATVNFAAYAEGGIGPYSFTWRFGDRTVPVNASQTAHAYAAGGVYRAVLTVLDSRNAVATSGTSILVEYPPVVVRLSVVPDPSPAGANVTLVTTSIGGQGNLSYRWTGLPATCGVRTSANVSCQFTHPGVTSVQVTVADSFGDISTASANVTVVASIATGLTVAGPSSALVTFDHLGWLLVPPLAGATVMAGVSSWVTFGAYRREKLGSGPQLLCYMPAEWKETPDDFVPP